MLDLPHPKSAVAGFIFPLLALQLDSISALKLAPVDDGVVDLIVFVGQSVCAIRQPYAASDRGFVQSQVENNASSGGYADRGPDDRTVGGTDPAVACLSGGGPWEA
jgi:hypothetical protein